LHAQAPRRQDPRLARCGAEAQGEVEQYLAIAEALASAAGGPRLWLPQIHEVRSELARVLGDEAGHARALQKAHRLYTATGADGHAARLVQELGL